MHAFRSVPGRWQRSCVEEVKRPGPEGGGRFQTRNPDIMHIIKTTIRALIIGAVGFGSLLFVSCDDHDRPGYGRGGAAYGWGDRDHDRNDRNDRNDRWDRGRDHNRDQNDRWDRDNDRDRKMNRGNDRDRDNKSWDRDNNRGNNKGWDRNDNNRGRNR